MLKKFVFTIVLSAGFLVSAGFAQQTAEKKSGETTNQESEQTEEKITLESLEGTWNIESIEFRGEKAPPQGGAPEVIKISEGVMNTLAGGKPVGTFSNLEMAIKEADPMQLDLVRERGGEQRTLPCILKFEENQLVIALPMVPLDDRPDMETARPKSFDSNDGQFLVLRAVKNDEEEEDDN